MAEGLRWADLAGIDVQRLHGVGEKRRSSLESAGITNLLELLTHYPRRYLDRSREARIAELVEGEEASVLVTVVKTSVRQLRGRRVMVTSRVCLLGLDKGLLWWVPRQGPESKLLGFRPVFFATTV